MNRQYYYINYINGKYRICKDYILYIQDDSVQATYKIYFINGIEKPNTHVFEKRRKARQMRDYLNKNKRYFGKQLNF